MDDLLREFRAETAENIAVLDVDLVKLEKNPNDPNLLSEIFRVVHTIKGTCGFLDLPRLEAVAHASEEVLGKIRDGDLSVTEEAVTLILESIDCIKGILATLEQTEAEPPGDDNDLIGRLGIFAQGGVAASEGTDDAKAAEAEPEAATEPPEDVAEAGANEAPQQAPAAAPAAVGATGESKTASQNIRVGVDLLEHLMTMVSELVLARNQLLQMVRGQTDNEFAAPLAAPEPRHHRAAGRGDEDPHAADRQRLGEPAAPHP